MGFILKFLIFGVAIYFIYRHLDKRFAIVDRFDAKVVSKFTNKNGKAVDNEDESDLNVKDKWNYFLVLKEESELALDDVVGEISPEDVSSSNLKEEVSQSLYERVSIGDDVVVCVSYSRWTKKLLKTEIMLLDEV